MTTELTEDIQNVQQADPLVGPVEGMFDRLATHLARSFDAPIALITLAAGERCFWAAQCGLTVDSFATNGSARDRSICNTLVSSDSLCVVVGTAISHQ